METTTSNTAYEFNTTIEQYRSPYHPSIAIWSGVILLIFLIIGIILNLVTILVIFRYKKLQNVFMQIITSLCVSDLLSASVSPLLWYRRTVGFEIWSLPQFLCKVYWGVDLMTSYSTSLHIMMFSILRLISIKYPRKFDRFTKRKAQIWIAILWAVSFFVGFVPSMFFFNSKVKDRLGNSPDSRWPGCTINVERYQGYRTYQFIAFPTFFLVPMFVITVTSALILSTVRDHSKAALRSGVLSKKQVYGRHRKEKQAALQLMLIVFSFFIGYMPFTAYQYWITSGIPNTFHFRVIDYWFGLWEYILLRFSECLNPVFYNIGSGNMRKYTKRFFKEGFSCLFNVSQKTRSSSTSIKVKASSTKTTQSSIVRLQTFSSKSSNDFGV